jgi:hypothetical protein
VFKKLRDKTNDLNSNHSSDSGVLTELKAACPPPADAMEALSSS